MRDFHFFGMSTLLIRIRSCTFATMLEQQKQVLLFASGQGSNARAILEHFRGRSEVKFPLIVTNNPQAGVFALAREYGIDVLLLDRDRFYSPILLDTLDLYRPGLLVLAGFLWKLPQHMVQHYANRIVNIHPSLLPAYGGKGMYGHHVHEAVVRNGETKTGMTIHLVNEEYDQGTILLQKTVELPPSDTPDQVAAKVLQLEHTWYPKVIESLLN